MLLAVGSPALVIACSSGSGKPPPDAGSSSSPDATVGRDASDSADSADTGAEPDASTLGDSSPRDAGRDAGPPDSGAKAEAGLDGGCFSEAYEIDAGPDAGTDVCGYVYGCGLSGTGLGASGCAVLDQMEDGGLVPIGGMTCWLMEGQGCEADAYAPGEGGAITILCSPCPAGGGRRPAGLLGAGCVRGGLTLAGYLARMAFEEDAAVLAFARMEEELVALGAPRALVGEAARAARDEARHTRAMGTLARKRGAASARTGTRARTRRAPRRSLSAIAAENAAEGCVRETYGALLTRWQSLRAEDPAVRRAFARIAADEARHAALSWAVAEWIEPQLDAKGKKRVAQARARAVRELRRAATVMPPRDLIRSAGLPPAGEAGALVEALARALDLAGSSPLAGAWSPPAGAWSPLAGAWSPLAGAWSPLAGAWSPLAGA